MLRKSSIVKCVSGALERLPVTVQAKDETGSGVREP